MSLYRPSRNILLLGLTSFFNDFSSEMVLAVFPAFFTSVLKTGASSLGMVEGLADGAANLIKIYAGRLSDRRQKRKPFILAGYSLSVAIRPLYLLVSTVGGVLGLRVTDRIGKGLREGPRDAIISLSTKPEELGRAFGYHRAMDTLGAVVGPLVAYLILRAYPGAFNTVFITAFVVGICAVLSITFIKEVAGAAKKKDISLAALSLYSPRFKRYLIALFFLSAGSIPVAVLLLKTQHLGLSLASIPLFYMLYNLSYAAFSVTGGGLSDKYGPKDIIRIGYLLLLCVYVMLALAQSIVALVLAFLALGLFPALTDGVQRALAAELSPSDKRGGAMGLVNAVSGFGLMFAGLSGGYIWEHFGVSTALIFGGVLVLVGVVILSRVSRAE